MYTDDDILSRHDRAAEGLIRQVLESNCGCEGEEMMPDGDSKHHCRGLSDHPLAMVYSPIQKWRNIYDNETALVRGTIFEELDLPFLGKCCYERKGGCASNGARMGERSGGNGNG